MTYDHANNDLVQSPLDPAAKGNDTSLSMEELLLIREKYNQLVEHAHNLFIISPSLNQYNLFKNFKFFSLFSTG